MGKLIRNNKILKGVVFKSNNIVIQKVQEGKLKKVCYIIGNGQSLSVNDAYKIVKHDPFMFNLNPKINNDRTVYAFYFTFESSGLEQSSKELAYFVNGLEEYDQIYLVGHSKCGVCFYNASYYCVRNIFLVTISAPFKGTLLADKKMVKTLLKSRLLYSVYNKIFSDHNVDKDIIENSNFLSNVKQALTNNHINIVSQFINIKDCKNPVDLILYCLNKILELEGDGIVPAKSQILKNTDEIFISKSHASSLKKGIKIMEDIIDKKECTQKEESAVLEAQYE